MGTRRKRNGRSIKISNRFLAHQSGLWIVAAVLMIFTFVSFCLLAGSLKANLPVVGVLQNQQLIELPARAVCMVEETSSTNRAVIIQQIIRSEPVTGHPGILPFVVSALVKKYPGSLDDVLGTAIEGSPDLVLVLAQACITQLPGKGEEIGRVVTRKTPWNVKEITQLLYDGSSGVGAVSEGIRRGLDQYYEGEMKPKSAESPVR